MAHTPSDTRSPAWRPWWRKWGCCCPSGPSCPPQSKTWRRSLGGLAPCPLILIRRLKQHSVIFLEAYEKKKKTFCAYALLILYALVGTESDWNTRGGGSHPRWRSGWRWESSCPRAQTLWPCSSGWCHESPQSSQTPLQQGGHLKKTHRI